MQSAPEPASRASWKRAIALLLLALLICLPALLISLGERKLETWHEGMSLASSQETWLRYHAGDSEALLIPSINGQPRIAKPPLLVWLNVLAWCGLSPEAASSEELISRARLVAVALGLLTIIGVFWIGCSLGDAKLGFIAAIMLDGLFFFQKHARTSSYDIAMLAWCTLAVAAALWAIPWKSASRSCSRCISGWTLAGALLGLGLLSKGPLCLVVFVLGVVPAIILLSQARLRDALGAACAILLSCGIALPWFLWLERHAPQVVERLMNEYGGPEWDIRPPWYYLARIGLTLPWTIWLMAGLFHPFLRARGKERRVRLVAWWWFVLVLAFFSFAPPKVPRYVLPVVPALALIAAQVWRDHEEAAKCGERDRGANWVIVPHWLGMVSVSAVFGPWLAAQPARAGRFDWIPQFSTIEISWQAAGWMTALLLPLAIVGWLLARTHPFRSAVIAGVWVAAFSSMLWHLESVEPTVHDAICADVLRVHEQVGESTLSYFNQGPGDVPAPSFLFYTRRIVPPVTSKHLGPGETDRPPFIMSSNDERSHRRLSKAGYQPIAEFRDAPSNLRFLWHDGPP